MKIFRVVKILAKDLVLRDSVAKLFEAISKNSDSQVSVDFKGVSSMTLSFAHEYLTLKNANKKEIVEINMPSDVKKLFEAVKTPAPRFRTLTTTITRPIPI